MEQKLFEKIEKGVTFISKFGVIVAIIFGILQVTQDNRIEERRVAIDAVSKTRTVEFIKAFTRLKTAYKSRKVGDKSIFIDDLNYVMNVYDYIADLYIHNIADRCIIKNIIHPAIKEFSLILDSLKTPVELRRNLDRFKELLEQEMCK